MRKVLIMFFLLSIAGVMLAQKPQQENNPDKELPRQAQRKFQILVTNEDKMKSIQACNDRLLALQDEARGVAQRGLLGGLLWSGYTSAITQKTVNAFSNLLSLGVNYAVEAIKGDREKWYRTAQQQCYYNKKLSSESSINDFYALPSTKGAMDPENLKFEGFGCKNYIELTDAQGEGVNVFYIFCKMRRDEEGLRHIVNHSKFLIDIDTLIITPRYCNLPNDSTGSVDSRFDFAKRDDLLLTLKVRLFSSWMNQAMMIANDQLLGEFTIQVKVDKNKLNADGCFVYDKNNPDFQQLVSVEGDCFIVPRSYTGTIDGNNYLPSWGTGQYRLEMEVSERCRIVDSYYQIREAGKGEMVAAMEGTPKGDIKNAEKWKWDKAKWKTEWKAMNARKKGDSFWENAWKCIVKAYKGDGWVATLTDPLATALYSYETTKLTEAFDDLHKSWFKEENNVQLDKSQTGGGNKQNPKTTPTPQKPGNNKP